MDQCPESSKAAASPLRAAHSRQSANQPLNRNHRFDSPISTRRLHKTAYCSNSSLMTTEPSGIGPCRFLKVIHLSQGGAELVKARRKYASALKNRLDLAFAKDGRPAS